MIADSYAKALFELNIPKEDINAARDLLFNNPPLVRILKSPAVDLKKKHAVTDRIFPESMRSFIKVVCDNYSGGYLLEIFKAYKEYSDKQNKILHIKMRCVTKPDEKQLEGIKAMLIKKHNMRRAEVDLIEDKSLIGGFIVTAGGFEYDRSIAGRLNDFKRQFIRR